MPFPTIEVEPWPPDAASEPQDAYGLQAAHDTSRLLQEQIRVAAALVRALAVQTAEARGLLDSLDTRRKALGSVDEQAAQLEDRADAIARLVESAEVNVAMLAHRAARAGTERVRG